MSRFADRQIPLTQPDLRRTRSTRVLATAPWLVAMLVGAVALLAPPPIQAAEDCSTAWKGALNVHKQEQGALNINNGAQVWATGDRVLGADAGSLKQQKNGACYAGDGSSPGPETECLPSERVESFKTLGLLPARPNEDYTAADNIHVTDGQTVTVSSDIDPQEVIVDPGGTLIIEGAVTINIEGNLTVGESGAAKRATVEVRGVEGSSTRIFAKGILYNEADVDVTEGNLRMINDQALRIESDSDLNCGAIETVGDQRRCTDADGGIFGISKSTSRFTESRIRGGYYTDGTQFNMTDVVFQGAATGGGMSVGSGGGNSPGSDVTQGQLPDTEGFCEQPGPGNALTTYRMDEAGWSGNTGEVSDFTGNGHDATAAGDGTTGNTDPAIAGDPGTCGYGTFDGDGDYVEDPDAGDYINGLAGITIMGWIKNTAGTGHDNGIFATTSPSGTDDNLGLRYDASGSDTGNSNLIKASINTDQCADNADCLQVETKGGVQTTDQWQHIAFVWQTGDKIRIYIDGAEVETTVTGSGIGIHQGTIDSVDFLRVGQSEQSAGDGWHGNIDELMVFDGPLTALEIQDLMGQTHPCPTLGQFGFDVGSGTASTCQPRAVTITARDSSGNVVTGYNGTIDLSTSSSHGSWSVNAGDGSLSDATLDDGAASYSFVDSDDGSMMLDLTNQHADDLTITVADSSAGASSTSDPLSFRDNAFVIASVDTLGADAVAGRDHAFEAQLWRRDPSSGDCAVAQAYDGDKGLKGWIARDSADPGGAAPALAGTALPDSMPGSNNLTLSFTDGVAPFDLATADVGKYAVNLRDDTSGFATDTAGDPRVIEGGSSTLIVRPFGLAIDFSGDRASNPDCASQASCAADAGGDGFTAAGQVFSTTVTAALWQSADDADGDGRPDSGADLTDNAAAVSFGQESPAETVDITHTLAAPGGGDAGTLTGGGAISGFTNGSATASLAWDEAGIIDLSAALTDGDYMGSGRDVTGVVTDVGRFTPQRLRVTDNGPSFAEACGTAFTYMDQIFTFDTAGGNEPRITVTGLNAAGNPTDNYDPAGGFWKLATTLASRAYTDNVGGAATLDAQTVGTVSRSNATDFDGQATYTITDDLFAYQRPTSPIAPFDADVDGSLPAGDLTDSDGVCHDPDDDGTCDAYTIAGIDGTALRFGRLRIANAHGSELVDLPMQASVQYYQDATNGFVTASDDTCTSLTDSPAAPPQWGDFELTNYQDALDAGETTPAWSGLSSGTASLTLSAPGGGNDGSVDVIPHLEPAESDQPWLQYDWDGDGSHDDNPSARATFGIFSNEDEWIYQREVY